MEVTEQLLGEAILDGNIRFVIQPILDARTGELMGGEALSRWYTGNGLIAVPTLQYLPLLKRLEWREPFHSILAGGQRQQDQQYRWGKIFNLP